MQFNRDKVLEVVRGDNSAVRISTVLRFQRIFRYVREIGLSAPHACFPNI